VPEFPTSDIRVDLAVIGSGPAGQSAALQAARLGKTVALIEKDPILGGTGITRGTLPTKILRESALHSLHEGNLLPDFRRREDIQMTSLLAQLDEILEAHNHSLARQLSCPPLSVPVSSGQAAHPQSTPSPILHLQGRARFLDPQTLTVESVRGASIRVQAPRIIIASGSVPHHPHTFAVDHEAVFDSDSILSLLYLPRSLVVLGSGMIACEYASIFQALGVNVTLIDTATRPLEDLNLDHDLTDTFVSAFTRMGGIWVGSTTVERVSWSGFGDVQTQCSDGRIYTSEKALCATGRCANTAELALANAGLQLNSRGLLTVDAHLQTPVAGIYAAGDAIDPAALTPAAVAQGQRACCHAFARPSHSGPVPGGIYSIPELATIGLSEEAATRAHGKVLVGRAHFNELARGHIAGLEDGLLKLVCAADGRRILGIMIAGEGATELIHIGQMAMQTSADVDIFVDSICNFPTLAEAYRVAALAVIDQRRTSPPPVV
jgi:NAD(P) transhydrogenase